MRAYPPRQRNIEATPKTLLFLLGIRTTLSSNSISHNLARQSPINDCPGGGTGHASSRSEAYRADLARNTPLHSKFILKNSSGYFNALKNRGVPENESGEMGPMVMNG